MAIGVVIAVGAVVEMAVVSTAAKNIAKLDHAEKYSMREMKKGAKTEFIEDAYYDCTSFWL